MMPTDIITIGSSGARASRASIEITAHNIANASNPDYARRRLNTGELVGSAIIDFQVSSAFSGVRIGGVQRADSELFQLRVRDSGSDVARADGELLGLTNAETALEQSRVYDRLVAFEASLTLLESDPTDPALRTGTIETAKQLAQTFRFADDSMESTRSSLATEIEARAFDVNAAAQELAQVNRELVSAREGSGGRAALLDARDAALRDLSQEIGIAVQFDEFGTATVEVDGAPPLTLVDGAVASTFAATVNPDSTVTLSVDGSVGAANTGAMAGRISALSQIAALADELDAIATSTITRANAAQASGSALDGSAGQPLFSGTQAGDMTVVLNDGAGLAVAIAGAPAGSRDTANLGNFIAAIGADDGPIAATDRALLSLSSRISGLDITRQGLSIINDSAMADLLAETGVDLDAEAADLIRLQQAFEANSRVIQVATSLFDTILGLR